MKIKYQLEILAFKPSKSHDNDAGFDLYARQDFGSWSNQVTTVDTGVHVLIPKGYVGLIFPRSSISKNGSNIPVGVIDAGYTGSIKITIHGIDTRRYCRGERIAQLVIIKLPNIELVEGDVVSEETERGQGGLGSTGR